MTRWIKALAVALCGCMVLSFCGFYAECEDISDRVLRLHVLAASDSKQDQMLKLKVRDAILRETHGLLDHTKDISSARETLQATLPQIEETATRCLRENGCADAVQVRLCEMYFTTRRYDNVTLPAGNYDALRVVIGEGKGKNWWCVVFPPMCLSGATKPQMDDALTVPQTTVVSNPNRYQVRFKLVEWIKGIQNRFQ